MPKNVSHYVRINIYGGCVTDAGNLHFSKPRMASTNIAAALSNLQGAMFG